MKFKLIYENHGNFGLHVGDYFLYLRYALEAAGHSADIEYAFCPGHINIVLECFNDEFTDKIEAQWCDGTGLIVIGTEFLTGQTFNDIYHDDAASQLASDHNLRRDFWDMRYRNFARLAPRFSAIWHVAEDQAQVYQQAFPDVPCLYMPHGYTDRFATVDHRPDHLKDIDVLFTGTMTAYRQEVLDSLSSANVNVVTSILFTAPFHREDLVSRSKLVLNIKQHPNWQHESVTRLYYHVCNDSLVLTERCKYPTDLHDYVFEVDGDDWLASVTRHLDEGGFCDKAEAVRKRFASEHPVAPLFAKLLARSGIVN